MDRVEEVSEEMLVRVEVTDRGSQIRDLVTL